MLKDKNDVDSVVKTLTEKLKMKDEEIERIQSDFDGQKKIIADLTSTIDKQMSKLKESKQRLQSQKNVMLAK
jgi:peptidoglycan hydrolase CwlO-like protein